MKNFSDVLLIEKNKLASPYPWVPLVHFDFPVPYNMWLAGDLTDVTYGGVPYTAHNIQVNLPDENVDAKVPECQILVANESRAFEYAVVKSNGGVDCKATITIVNTNFLSEDYSNLTWNFDILQVSCTAQFVTLTCSLYSALYKRFPPDRFFAKTCRYKYFKGTECQYIGVPTACDRSYDTCKSYGNIKNFGGFPGIHDSNMAFLFTKGI